MKKFWAFVKKEVFHILRDVRTLVILFGIPVIQVVLFGFAITNEVNNAPIVILDHSRDKETKEITDKIFSSGYFRMAGYLSSASEIEEVFKEGKVKAAVVFGPDFAKKISASQSPSVQLIADSSDPNIGSTVIAYLSSIISSYRSEIGMALPVSLMPEPRMMYNPSLKSSYYFVPGVIAVLAMLISAMLTSITIAREKEFGNMEVLLVSPLKPSTIIAGKATPYVFLALIIATIILILGAVVFRMPIEGNLMLLMLELLLFVTTSLSLGILISTIANNQLSALMMSLMGLMLPTILLSGFIFPVENMPWILRVISNIIPARWFIIIIKNIMLKGAGWSAVWEETLILAGMTLIFMSLSIRNFKTRLA